MDRREERREELVGQTVEQARDLAAQAKRLAGSEARLAAEEARDVLAPAIPALRRGAAALGLGVLGGVLLLLPWAGRAASHPVICSLAGGAILGLGIRSARQASREFPQDLRGRVRELLRTDLGTAVRAATEPSRH